MGRALPREDVLISSLSTRPSSQFHSILLLLLPLFVSRIDPSFHNLLLTDDHRSPSGGFSTTNDTLARTGVPLWWERSSLCLVGANVLVRNIQQSLYLSSSCHVPLLDGLCDTRLTLCPDQYFLWYLWLLPPALPRLSLSRNRAIVAISVWVASQVSIFDLSRIPH